MAVIENILKGMDLTLSSRALQSKFKGCLLGSLMGDCLGAPYEGEDSGPGHKNMVQKYFSELENPEFHTTDKMYTDDTAMMKSMAACLLEKPAVDCAYLAKLFVKEYFIDPRRGYGENVVDVFKKLRTTKFQDPFKPANEQFGGNGSYGNGGAMRIAPVALYFFNNYKAMIRAATEMTKVTHTHKQGINGAILQCIAIQQSLLLDPEQELNVTRFVDDLTEKMAKVEDDDEGLELEDPFPYQTQLKMVKEILESNNSVADEDVIENLGNSVSALYSVPTAIYCFLRAQKDIPYIKTENKFRRTLQYAVSLGGDTDTIACMAGSIAGAYYGDGIINGNLLKYCEDHTNIVTTADKLYNAIET